MPIWKINFCSAVLLLSKLPSRKERPQTAICCLEWLRILKCLAKQLRWKWPYDVKFYTCRRFVPKSKQVQHVENKNSNTFIITLHLYSTLILKLDSKLITIQWRPKVTTNWRSTFDEGLFEWRSFFFTLYCEINLSQIKSCFPLIINSNSRGKTGLFSSFVRHTSQLSGIFHSQTLQINFSVCNCY